MRMSLSKAAAFEKTLRPMMSFRYDKGKSYRIVFPVDEQKEPYLYVRKVHNVRLGTGNIMGKRVCLADFNEEGYCPFCELRRMFYTHVDAEVAEYVKNNPDATEEDIAKYKKSLTDNKVPVGRVEGLYGFIVAVLEYDERGMKPKTDSEGKIPFTLQMLFMSNAQFNKKFLIKVEQIDNELDFTEMIFTYPEADSKMESARNLDMSFLPNPDKASKVIDPTLIERIKEEIDKLDTSEENIQKMFYQLRPMNMDEAIKAIAAKRAAYLESMSDEEKAAYASKLKDNMDAVNVGDLINTFLNEDEPQPQVTEVKKDSPNKMANAILAGLADEDEDDDDFDED